MAPAVVEGADLRGGLVVAAEQGIDERRLPHARGPEQDARAPAAQVRGDGVDAVAAVRAGDDGGDARRGAAHDGERGLDVGDEVGLVEDEHRVAAARGGHGHQALEAAGVEVAVGRGDDEGDVDVGGQLLLGAGQHAAARQPRVDDAVIVDDDPVADGRVLGHTAGDDGERLPVRAGHHEAAAMDGDHARGRAVVGVGGGEGRGERFAPAQFFEVQGALQARCGLDGGNDRQHRGGEQAGVEVVQQGQTLLRGA